MASWLAHLSATSGDEKKRLIGLMLSACLLYGGAERSVTQGPTTPTPLAGANIQGHTGRTSRDREAKGMIND